jgi:suppressor of ftsI
MKRSVLSFAVAFAMLAGCNGGSSGPSALVPSTSGNALGVTDGRIDPDIDVNELPQPPTINSVNGIAKLDLVTTVNPATGFPGFDYQGQHNVIPTIRINPGDTIVVNVDDEMQPIKGMTDDVNLHFHGLVVSPNAPGDDVLDTMAGPGQKLHYVVHVPKWQEPGLYWYHPHIHGVVNYQVGEGGMSGAIIVNGLERHIPALAKMKERLIIVRSTGIGNTIHPYGGDMTDMSSGDMAGMSSDDSDPTMQADARPNHSNKTPCGPDTGLTTSLNGALHPDITIAPGEQQFFRLVNASGHKTLKLEIDGGQMQLVAVDGYALDSYPGTPSTLTEKYIIVPAAARAEFVVTGPASGTAKFRSDCYDTGPNGDPDPSLVLGNIVPPKHPGPMQHPMALTVAPNTLPDNAYSSTLPAPSVTRRVVFSEGPVHFFINGKYFKPNDPPMFTAKLGTIERWHIVNVTKEIHAFHIHQIHFLVIDINGVKVQHPYWADTVVLPHRSKQGLHGTPGYIDALMDFRDSNIKGMFVFHCHILDHEDHGMMAKIQVI